MTSRDLAKVALGVAFLSICSQISIPLPHVPITLQLFAITLIALSFSPIQSIWTITIYILMGLLGLPIFAGFKGGFQSILSPSFGFILGFAIYTAILSSNLFKNTVVKFICAYLVFYLIGLGYLYFNLKLILEINTSVSMILRAYWLVFIPTDIFSILFAKKISSRLKGFK